MNGSTAQRAPLIVPRSLVSRLMRLYDYPHPRKRGRVIRGYDRLHAVRTARMSAAVASALGHGKERVRQYQIACLLHDLGRAGDRKSTRLNSSHPSISYAVFCLKKKKKK